MDVASAYLSHGPGPRLASTECEKFVHSALQQYNIKFDKLATDSRNKLNGLRQKLDVMGDAQQQMEVKFESMACGTLADIKEQSRVAIEESKHKTYCACKNFMEQATLLMKEHWHAEADRQKEEGFINTLSTATLKLLNEDLESMEARIKEASVDAVSNQVEECYQSQWKQELLTRVREDVLGTSFKKAVSDEVKTHIEEVSNRMRTVSQTMLAKSREHAYSKAEVDKLLQSNAEGADHMVQVVCRDLEALQKECRELSQTVTDTKAYEEQHAGERANEESRKHEAEKMQFEQKMLEHVDKCMAGIQTSMDHIEDEVKRASAMTDDVEQRLRATVGTAIDRLDAQLVGERNERIEAHSDLATKLAASEDKAATVATALENSVSDHAAELLSAIGTERARITANRNSIVTAQTAMDTQARALSVCEVAIKKSDEAASSALDAVRCDIATLAPLALVESNAVNAREGLDDALEQMKRTLAALDELREDVGCLGRDTVACARRLDTYEAEAERAVQRVRKSEVDVSRPLKEMRAELDLMGDIKGQLVSIRCAQKEEREERTKEFTDLRRDLDFVVRPLLGDAGDSAEGGGNLITSLARTCLDWQKEMQLLREKVKDVQQSQHGIDAAVKNMFVLHERQVGQYISDHQTGIGTYATDVRQAAQETMNWVRSRRTSDELQIEEHFLRQHKNHPDSVQLSEAMREMLTELHRQMSGAEHLLASQIGRLHGDVDKMQKVVTKVQHALAEMQRE
eukprot:GEMP01016255.1.p1 GENE.GEMP01016255.1~~GEMP01016255.1.p1  ORF type:complete len:746 (+),score=280.89 GEMP01016255.1:117-2354(+)